MQPIAQTNVQLYNQLRRSGYSKAQLLRVHRAYQLAIVLYSGCFQADGKPIVNHTVGVASILAFLQLPATVVAAGCIHNIYVNGDFGDGLKRGVTPQRRQTVRTAVSPEVENYIDRFRRFRLTVQTVPEIFARLDELDAVDRHLVVMDLADILEKYADQSILYTKSNKHKSTHVADRHSPLLIEMANRLGYPQLAVALSEALHTAAEDSIPDFLVSANPYAKLVVPSSCRMRSDLAVRQILSRVSRVVSRVQSHITLPTRAKSL